MERYTSPTGVTSDLSNDCGHIVDMPLHTTRWRDPGRYARLRDGRVVSLTDAERWAAEYPEEDAKLHRKVGNEEALVLAAEAWKQPRGGPTPLELIEAQEQEEALMRQFWAYELSNRRGKGDFQKRKNKKEQDRRFEKDRQREQEKRARRREGEVRELSRYDYDAPETFIEDFRAQNPHLGAAGLSSHPDSGSAALIARDGRKTEANIAQEGFNPDGTQKLHSQQSMNMPSDQASMFEDLRPESRTAYRGDDPITDQFVQKARVWMRM